MLGAERLDLGEVAGDQGRRHQLGKFHHEHFFRRIAHLRRVVDDQRLGLEPLEQVRRRDVGEIERGILAQQHHVERSELGAFRCTELEMIALPVAHLQRPHRREHPSVPQRQLIRRVIGDGVTTLLCFQQQGEGGIAADVDPLDRVHLHGDFEAHR